MASLLPVGIILFLVGLNAFFVMAEFAIVGIPRATVESHVVTGNRIALVVRRILKNPRLLDRYIATAQLGITVASLGLGMYGEHVLADAIAAQLTDWGTLRWIAAHSIASVVAIAILTYLHIVLGEMVPKSIALQYADRAALWVTPPLLWAQYLTFPLVVGLNGLGNGLLRLMGIRRQMATSYFHTQEELQYIVQESEEGGMLRPEAGRVLRDLFEFGERTASEVMIPRVHVLGIPVDADAEDVGQILHTARHTRYPVYDGDLDHIVGMVHIKDIFRLLLADGVRIREIIRPVPYVPETSELDAVLETMRQAHSQIVIVMDEHGGTAGLITIEDLFEEVVGDIDEGTSVRPDIYRDGEGRLHVTGTVRLDEVGEYIDMTLEHEEVDTVSGLVLMLLDRPPVIGDAVRYQHVRFEVTAVEGHGVGECVVTPSLDKNTDRLDQQDESDR